MTVYAINKHFSGVRYYCQPEDMRYISDDITAEKRLLVVGCGKDEKELRVKEHPEFEPLLKYLVRQMRQIFRDHKYMRPVGYTDEDISLDMTCLLIIECENTGNRVRMNIQKEPGLLCAYKQNTENIAKMRKAESEGQEVVR